MILKGILSELSNSTILHHKNNKIEVVRYDYIDIGDEHKRECITSTYLSNFLSKNVGQNIALAYIEANMTNSLGRETIHIGNTPKHTLITGIKDSIGKIITDKDLIELKGNQHNPLTGCLKNLIFLLPLSGLSAFLTFNTYGIIYGLIAIGLFVFFLKSVQNKRKNLESEMLNELKNATI